MSGSCLFKIPHSCGSKDGLQVFEKEGGEVDGYCFSCKTYVPDPLGGQSVEDFPVKKRLKKTSAIPQTLAIPSSCDAGSNSRKKQSPKVQIKVHY